MLIRLLENSKGELYHPLVKNPHFDHAKAPRLNDRRCPNIVIWGHFRSIQPWGIGTVKMGMV